MNISRHNMLNVIVWAIVACLCTSAFGGTMNVQEYYTWGIDGDDLNIPEGSIITEAVLTIQGITNWDNNLHIHIVDNPPLDFVANVDNGSGDFFQDFDGLLSGYSYQLVDGDLVITFIQINDENSWVWDIFDYPFNFQLADSSVVSYSSSLLELIDYAGNSTPFGIGFDSDTTDYAFDRMTLELTIESYEGQAEQSFLRLTTYGLAEPDPIVVTSPNGGESYLAGSRITATWTPGEPLDSDVKIELYKGNAAVYTIASGTPNDGRKGRILPDTLTAGSDYRIKITSLADESVYDFSDDYFQIVSQQATPDPIVVTSPNGGEVYNLGDTLIARWIPNGDISSNVKIELYKGNTAVYTIASGTANDGRKGRILPDTLTAGSDYRIKITSLADESVYDFSDGYFELTGR